MFRRYRLLQLRDVLPLPVLPLEGIASIVTTVARDQQQLVVEEERNKKDQEDIIQSGQTTMEAVNNNRNRIFVIRATIINILSRGKIARTNSKVTMLWHQ